MSENKAPKLEGIVPAHMKVRQTRLVIDSVEVMADIGFHDFEVGTPQRLFISVDLYIDDYDKPPEQDHPDFAWNYDVVVQEIRRIAGEGRYNLQETLVHKLFERLAALKSVRDLRIRSVKPDVYPDAKGVGVEIASFRDPRP